VFSSNGATNGRQQALENQIEWRLHRETFHLVLLEKNERLESVLTR